MEINLSANNIMNIIKKLLREFEIDSKNVGVYIKE